MMRSFGIAAAVVLACAASSAEAQNLGRASAGFGARAGGTSQAFSQPQTIGGPGISSLSLPSLNLIPLLTPPTQPLSSTQLTTGINTPLTTAPTFLSILGAAGSAATGLPTSLSQQ